MENTFRYLCLVGSDELRDEIKNIIRRINNLNPPRIDKKNVKVIFDDPLDFDSSFFEVVLFDVNDQKIDRQNAEKLLNLSEQFSLSKLVAICDLNLRDYSNFSLALRESGALSVGTACEGINKILELLYLWKKDNREVS